MKALVWATIDTLACLLLVVLAALNPPPDPAKAAIETHGRWVVVVSWPAGDNDIDTWLRAPDGSKVWWQHTRTRVAHLEQDDLGAREDNPDAPSGERMVIRSALPGEYAVSIHAYAAYAPPVPVRAELWRLQGEDRRVYVRQVVVRANRQELSVFRFSLSADGTLQEVNELPAQIVHL